MTLRTDRLLVATAAFVGAGLLAPPLTAQSRSADEPLIYEREVFHYDGYSRVDPFRSLLSQGDLWIRLEDLSLRGVVIHEDPSRSVAVLIERGTDRRIQARSGERVGSLRVIAIEPDQVVVVVEELGVARREVLLMDRPETPVVRESAR